MFALKQPVVRGIPRAGRSACARRLLIVLVQTAIFTFSALAAFLLRFEFTVPRSELDHLRIAILVWIAAKAVAFQYAGLNRGWWRFVSVHDLGRLALANTVASGLGFALIGLSTRGFPGPSMSSICCSASWELRGHA